MIRRLAHEPLGWRPTTLEVTIRRYRCADCSHVWRQDTTRAAEPRAKLSRRGLAWGLVGIVVQHLTVARVAEGLGVAWNTANDAVLAEGKRVLIDDATRFNGVTVLGVDEHVWRHTRHGDKYVTVIIDLTGIRDGRASPGSRRAKAVTTLRIAGTLAPKWASSLLRYRFSWAARSESPAARSPQPVDDLRDRVSVCHGKPVSRGVRSAAAYRRLRSFRVATLPA